jgi:hypothetical protein
MVKKTRTVYRDSKTGEWTSKANVKRNPSGTETERRPVGKRKPKK